MSVGSLYSPPSQQQIGPASAQPLSMVTQYRRHRLEGDFEAYKEAYDAGDSASYGALTADIQNQLPQAGLDTNIQGRLANDTVNPGPSSLSADEIYMKDLNTTDSVLGPATKSTYTSDDLSSMNNPGMGSATGPGGYATPPSSPGLGPTAYGAPPPSNNAYPPSPPQSPQLGPSAYGSAPPSMNNLPSFGTPSGS